MRARPVHSEGRPGEADTSETVYARELGFIRGTTNRKSARCCGCATSNESLFFRHILVVTKEGKGGRGGFVTQAPRFMERRIEVVAES